MHPCVLDAHLRIHTLAHTFSTYLLSTYLTSGMSIRQEMEDEQNKYGFRQCRFCLALGMLLLCPLPWQASLFNKTLLPGSWDFNVYALWQVLLMTENWHGN